MNHQNYREQLAALNKEQEEQIARYEQQACEIRSFYDGKINLLQQEQEHEIKRLKVRVVDAYSKLSDGNSKMEIFTTPTHDYLQHPISSFHTMQSTSKNLGG